MFHSPFLIYAKRICKQSVGQAWNRLHVGRTLLHQYLLKINSYSASHDNWCTATLWNRIMTAQCEGMGEVGSARYEPALLPPCPSIRALSYSNCQEIYSRQQTGLAVQVLSWFVWLNGLLVWGMPLNWIHYFCIL